MALEIRILGSGREVGRSAVLVEDDGKKLLLDYGVMLAEDEPKFPLSVRPRELAAIVLSHAHLDHSGAVPLLYSSWKVPLVATRTTLDLAMVLIQDFLKLSKYYVPYENAEVGEMASNLVEVEPGDGVEIGGVEIRVFGSGHIPGGIMALVDTGSYRVLYTGDYSIRGTCMLEGASLEPFRKADVIVTEGTYAKYDHPRWDENEKRFYDAVMEVVDNGGVVLVPSFAVGRAQEVACSLARQGFEGPIFVDGMARQVIDIIFQDGFLLRGDYVLRALGRVRKVRGRSDRKRVVAKPGVVISSSGTLKGGASVFYMERVMGDPRNGVFFVSYLIPGTPGRNVISTGVYNNGENSWVKARVEWFDFSSHAGRGELLRAISSAKKGAKIVVVHSDPGTGDVFADELRSLGREVFYPKNGERLVFK